MKRYLILVITVILSSVYLIAEDFASERIDGLAAFLVDRANENYFYIFEEEVASNELFMEYFPSTHKLASSGNLKVLINSSDLWDESITSDIDTIISKSLQVYLSSITGTLSGLLNINNIDKLLVIANKTTINIDGKEYSIASIPISPSSEVREKINSIYDPLDVLKKSNKNINNVIKDTVNFDKNTDYTNITNNINDQFENIIVSYNSLITAIKTDELELSNHDLLDLLHSNLKLITDKKETFEAFIKLYNDLEYSSFEDFSTTLKVIRIYDFLEQTIILNNLRYNKTEFDKFNKILLVFAQLSDAET